MGGSSGKRPYGALDKAPQLDHETYFKVKSSSAIMLAFVVAPESVAAANSAFSQVVIVTHTGIDVYNLKSSKLQSSSRREIVAATVGVQSDKKVLVYVEPDNTVYVSIPATGEIVKKMDFSEKVTALKLVPDKYLAIGFETGAVSWADLGTLTVAQIETRIKQPVNIFSAVRSKEVATVVTGFKSAQQSKLFLFTPTEGAIQTNSIYESLPGTCADVAIMEAEKLVLSLCEGTGALYIWDLENCNYLLSVNLSPTNLTRMLAFESNENVMTIVFGGVAGVVVGILEILESTIRWTPKSRSQMATRTKVKPGSVQSLEHDKQLDLLVYGDESGQVWLIPGPLPGLQRPSFNPKGPLPSSEAPLSINQ